MKAFYWVVTTRNGAHAFFRGTKVEVADAATIYAGPFETFDEAWAHFKSL